MKEYSYGGVGQPFEGLPHDLDSAFTLPGDQIAYAFKGSTYYKLNLQTDSYTHSTPNYNDDATGVQITGGSVESYGSYTSIGFTLSGSGMSGYYTGTWTHAGIVHRVGNAFVSSIDIGIYRHDYGSDTYVLYYFKEGIPESPVWVLTKFGNNQGTNAIAPDHNFLNAVGMHGTQIQLVSGASQTVNGTQYPPADALGGTMTIG